MKYIVSGCTGHLGLNLVKYLLSAGKTVKAIALPGEKAEETVAYQIAVQTVEELKQKTFLELPMPMTKDRELLEKSHEEAADRVEECLQKGQNVVFLTLGDPTVYSTYLYEHKRSAQRGYRTELTCGITSFCAVAALLNIGQVE